MERKSIWKQLDELNEGYRQDLGDSVINALAHDLENGYKGELSYMYKEKSSISLEQAIENLKYDDDRLETAYYSRGAQGRHVGPAPGYHWLNNDHSWRVLLNNVIYELKKHKPIE